MSRPRCTEVATCSLSKLHAIEQQLYTVIRISQRLVNILRIEVNTNSVLICTLVVVYVFLWIIRVLNTDFSENYKVNKNIVLLGPLYHYT